MLTVILPQHAERRSASAKCRHDMTLYGFCDDTLQPAALTFSPSQQAPNLFAS